MIKHNTMRVLGAYQQWALDELEKGYDAYLLTFMFRRICGSYDEIYGAMSEAVTRCYATLLTRVFRYPNSEVSRLNPMKWIVAPDRPVPKHARKSLREVTLNGGLHMHGIALVPPFTRLKRPLDAEIVWSQAHLAIDPLLRVHAVCVETRHDYVTDYAMKSLKREVSGFDDLIILPRSQKEVPGRELGQGALNPPPR